MNDTPHYDAAGIAILKDTAITAQRLGETFSASTVLQLIGLLEQMPASPLTGETIIRDAKRYRKLREYVRSVTIENGSSSSTVCTVQFVTQHPALNISVLCAFDDAVDSIGK